MLNAPDPVVGEWTGNQLPMLEPHIVFFENQTYAYYSYRMTGESVTETGRWEKNEKGMDVMRSYSGNRSEWVYDSFSDAVYSAGPPQLKFDRNRE